MSTEKIKNEKNNNARQAWMATLARTSTDTLQNLIDDTGVEVNYTMPRPPEIGLCMVRGKMGGNGQRFNLGEMTVTRCVVQLEDNTAGISYVLGRDRRHAELAAVADALLINGSMNESVLSPMNESIQKKRQVRAEAVASTKVDFFTLVRGEN